MEREGGQGDEEGGREGGEASCPPDLLEAGSVARALLSAARAHAPRRRSLGSLVGNFVQRV